MHIYLFEESDGYYSRILAHKQKLTEKQIREYTNEIPDFGRDIDAKCDWLIANKGFEAISYTAVDLDGGLEGAYVTERMRKNGREI